MRKLKISSGSMTWSQQSSRLCFTSSSQIVYLIAAADRYGVEMLRLLCESKLSEAIDVETVAMALALAEQHNCSQLR
jgi:hypothetical protein